MTNRKSENLHLFRFNRDTWIFITYRNVHLVTFNMNFVQLLNLIGCKDTIMGKFSEIYSKSFSSETREMKLIYFACM